MSDIHASVLSCKFVGSLECGDAESEAVARDVDRHRTSGVAGLGASAQDRTRIGSAVENCVGVCGEHLERTRR